MSQVPNGLAAASSRKRSIVYARRRSILKVHFVVKALSRPSLILPTSRPMSAFGASRLMSWMMAIPPARLREVLEGRLTDDQVEVFVCQRDAAGVAQPEVDAHLRLPGVLAGYVHEGSADIQSSHAK